MDQAQTPPIDEVFEGLRHYRDIVDDFDAFLASARQPLPVCIWTNPLRYKPEALRQRLEAYGIEVRPSRFFEGAFLLPHGTAPGNAMEYALGLYHVQEEIALTAVHALDPQPGERILDMCASPGNKTARTAALMQDTGVILANELKHGRLAAMRANLERLGITNTMIRCGDGSNVPLTSGPFDRVMADVPCSCEGTVRKKPGFPGAGRMADDLRLRLSRVQGHLLRRALKLTKPGGVVIYATCTFAPEENEVVLDEVLRHHGKIVPFAPPGDMITAPGLTHWQGRQMRPDLIHAQRYYPHHNDTGGFFVARIQVEAP